MGECSNTVWQLIKRDLYRYGGRTDIIALLNKLIYKPGFQFSFWFRLVNHFRKKRKLFYPLWLTSRFMLHHYRVKYGIQISAYTDLGPGLYIGYVGTIVVNRRAVIGADCNIGPGVTIGAKNDGVHKGVPVIGDRVYIAGGAKILGSVKIGNDVLIGANCVVVHDVPSGAIVAGIPDSVLSYSSSASYMKFTTTAPSPQPTTSPPLTEP